jgi:hypothetical protein
MTTRRMILKTGAAAILVTSAGGAWWGNTRTPTKALAPWDAAKKGYGDPRLDALAYAILAPNPHNRQPWRVELVGEDAFDLRCDLDRRLPETDPFDRQITIGLGCFLELFHMAAAVNGFETTIEPFPDGEPQPRLDGRRVARVTVTKTAPMKDPLFDAVFDRRSTKTPYDVSRPIARGVFDQLLLNNRISGTLETGAVEGLRELSWRAHEIESITPRTMKESVDLMRFGKAEVEANPDGIDFSGAAYELMNITGLMTRENIGDPTSVSFAEGMNMYHELLHTAMGHVWVTSAGNNRADQLRAGQDWVRLNLKATQLGLAIHPLSQALQEYVEMETLYNELHRSLGVAAPARVQMFARIGYGPETGPSPRWPMETVLVNA